MYDFPKNVLLIFAVQDHKNLSCAVWFTLLLAKNI